MNPSEALRRHLRESGASGSEALRRHLRASAESGSRSAILFAQIALFTATIFFGKTRLYAEHDSTGFKTALSYQIMAILVSNSRHLSRGPKFIPIRDRGEVNSIANLIGFILAFFLGKFYEQSLSSLGFALSLTVLNLILLVIIRPCTDLGLFYFLFGVVGLVTYNLFELKSLQIWIAVAICHPLLGFRLWLDNNWLEVEVGEDQSMQSPLIDRSTGERNQISKLQIIEELTVTGFHLFWFYSLFRTNCQAIKGPPESMSCNSSYVMGVLAYVLIFNLWFGDAVIARVYSLFQTEPAAFSVQRCYDELFYGADGAR